MICRVRRIALAALLSVAFSLLPAAANDSTFGGSGSDLIPLTETTIRMASEEITFTAVKPLSFEGNNWGECPNPLYADSLLSPAEWAYAERAKKEEARRLGAKK